MSQRSSLSWISLAKLLQFWLLQLALVNTAAIPASRGLTLSAAILVGCTGLLCLVFKRLLVSDQADLDMLPYVSASKPICTDLALYYAILITLRWHPQSWNVSLCLELAELGYHL